MYGYGGNSGVIYDYDANFAGTFEHVINNHSFPSLELLMSFLFKNSSNFCNESCAVCEIKKFWDHTTFLEFYGKMYDYPQAEVTMVMLIYIISLFILFFFIYRKQIEARTPLWFLDKKKPYEHASVIIQLVKLLPYQVNLGLGLAIKYIYT